MRSRDDTTRATRPKAGAGLCHLATGDRRDRAGGAGWEFVHVAIDDADADRLAG